MTPHTIEMSEAAVAARGPGLQALNASGFITVSVPEEYVSQGADSVATCIVIADPEVNTLGIMGFDSARLGRV